MSVIKLGSPAIPVKLTEYGTCFAKLSHIWLAARRYAKHNDYKVVETYGVMGVAPFQKFAVAAWLTYLKVPHKQPIELYEFFDNKFSWAAEWSSGLSNNTINEFS